jgi:hypothetical protein
MKTNGDEKLPSSSAMPNQVQEGMFIQDNTTMTI